MPTLINGTAYGWSSIGFSLFGNPIRGIKAIDYGAKQGKTNVMGIGDKPIARGYENYSYEGSIEIMIDELKALQLLAPDGDIMKIPPFTLPITMGSSRVIATTDILRGVEFLENPFKATQGEGSLWVKIPLIIADISFNQ